MYSLKLAKLASPVGNAAIGSVGIYWNAIDVHEIGDMGQPL